jgi:predicted DNA-binding transcriptional regulator AlpA
MAEIEALDYRLLRLPEVLKIIPVSKAAFYKGIAKNQYPQPIKISSRLSVWKLADIRECVGRLERDYKQAA